MSINEEFVEKAQEFYDYPLTLLNLIKWGVDTFPEQEVIYAPPDAPPKLRLTFAQVWDRVRRLASALEQLGVKPGDPKRLGTSWCFGVEFAQVPGALLCGSRTWCHAPYCEY
ncbi:hypothetical protein [Vulcanisaeta souniana]|uniref:hypothetical protein n=1 Tax=Vulcanisaeta souniana TaxID=164452 RepID=UPI000AF872A6|nr:hypothetical protein [Vulcanisaeta souniana]